MASGKHCDMPEFFGDKAMKNIAGIRFSTERGRQKNSQTAQLKERK